MRSNPRSSSRVCALGYLAYLAAACSEAPADGFAPYAGTAYPNRRPRFEAAGRTLGYVANRMSDTVSVIDLDAMQLLGTAPVGRDPADTDGPRHVVLDEQRGLAYVALTYPLEVRSPHVVMEGDPVRASYVQVLALDDFRPLGEVRVDPSAEELALSEAGERLVISHRDPLKGLAFTPTTLVWVDQPWRLSAGSAEPGGSSEAAGSDTASSVELQRLAPCVAPASLAWGAHGLVYVACTGEDTIAVIDAGAEVPRMLGVFPAGRDIVNQPYALVLDPARRRLLVSNQVARTVAVYNVESGLESAEAPMPVQLGAVPLDGVPSFAGFLGTDTLVIPHREPSGAVRVSAQTLAAETLIAFSASDCENPSEAATTPDGRLFLVCEGDHFQPGTVLKLNPSSLAIEAKVSVGVYPDRLAIRPGSQ